MTNNKKGNVTISAPLSFSDIGAFIELCKELRFENRFFLREKAIKFIDDIIQYAKEFKLHEFSSEEHFYRARIHTFKMATPHFTIEEIGAPPTHEAKHGRVNPVGIPYLYLANDILTAVSEVRPWIGCDITVAEFILNRNVSVINFSKKIFTNVPADSKYQAAETTWRELITWMFSYPFDPRDDTAYMPTQYVTERIKKEGFDGILYDSALNANGYNLALFSERTAAPIKLHKVKVNSINYEINESEIKTTSK